MRLGSLQITILLKLHKKPGQTTWSLLKGDKNRPEKKLQDYGLIFDGGNEKKHKWFITEEGVLELAKRELI